MGISAGFLIYIKASTRSLAFCYPSKAGSSSTHPNFKEKHLKMFPNNELHPRSTPCTSPCCGSECYWGVLEKPPSAPSAYWDGFHSAPSLLGPETSTRHHDQGTLPTGLNWDGGTETTPGGCHGSGTAPGWGQPPARSSTHPIERC